MVLTFYAKSETDKSLALDARSLALDARSLALALLINTLLTSSIVIHKKTKEIG